MPSIPKPSMAKKKKRPSRKSQRSKADKLWSLAIRKKHPVCVKCKSRPSIHAHHIFSRKRLSTRHDLNNGLALCGGCHMEAHHEPYIFEDWLKGEWFKNHDFDRLKFKSRELCKPDYDLIAIGLEEIVNAV